MNQTYWIWYPGDFAIHQGMLQNFSREERGDAMAGILVLRGLLPERKVFKNLPA